LTLNVIFSIIASMTTYQYNLTMPAVSPAAASGAYPVAIADATYIPADTMIFKLNDTVRIKVTHPLGYEIRLSVADAFGGDPNPTSPSSATYPINSGGPTAMPNDIGGWFPNNTVFGLTWSGTFAGGATAATDHLTRWYFHGRNAAFPNGSGSHSAEARLRKVVYPTFSVSPTSVLQGGSVTFTSGAITGITASGNFGNRLYVSIFNSSNQLITSTGSSGVSFDSSSVYFGKVGTSDLNTVMTAGSSLPAGLYHAYLTHYNGATLLNNSTTVGNRFIGSEQRVAGPIYFNVTAPQATGPNAFDSALGADGSGVPISNPIFSSVATISGMANPSSNTVTASGNGSPKVSINGGAYVTSGTVSNGQTVQLRFNASNAFSATHTGTLTIRGVTGSVSASTQADPGTSGGSTGTSGAAAAYGLEVQNGNGVTIFGPDFRSAHVIATGSWTAAGNSNSQTYTVEGMTSSNRNTIGVLIGLGTAPGTSATTIVHYGTNGFYIQNTTSASRSGTYLAIRY
jgi:hypothetical protein